MPHETPFTASLSSQANMFHLSVIGVDKISRREKRKIWHPNNDLDSNSDSKPLTDHGHGLDYSVVNSDYSNLEWDQWKKCLVQNRRRVAWYSLLFGHSTAKIWCIPSTIPKFNWTLLIQLIFKFNARAKCKAQNKWSNSRIEWVASWFAKVS